MNTAQTFHCALQYPHLRQINPNQRFHVDKAFLFCQLLELHELFRLHSDRLFADNVLSMLQKQLALAVMQGIGACNINRIDLLILSHCFQIGVYLLCTPLFCKLFPFFLTAGIACSIL